MNALLQISAAVFFGVPFIIMLGIGIISMISPKSVECEN